MKMKKIVECREVSPGDTFYSGKEKYYGYRNKRKS
ncbi:MAG: hypothetical protein NSGCLCUN01_04010 [uncultured Clostridium sp.]